MGVGCSCPPVCNVIETPRHLFSFFIFIVVFLCAPLHLYQRLSLFVGLSVRRSHSSEKLSKNILNHMKSYSSSAKSHRAWDKSDRARKSTDRARHRSKKSCYSSFRSSSYSSTVGSIELGVGLIELELGLRIDNAGAPSWPVYPALFSIF